MRVIKADSEEAIAEAVAALSGGGVIAYPTETYYALGARFDMEDALKRLYAVKGRPRDKAMPLVIGSREGLSALALPVNRTAEGLMQKHWPGPLTLVLQAVEGLPELVTSGGKVAVLARAAGFPITATSANPSGNPPASDAEGVLRYFGDALDLVVDGGPAPGSQPSTLVDASGEKAKVLRVGAMRVET
jgi:L-threonylcarbamoyladenylate synthase